MDWFRCFSGDFKPYITCLSLEVYDRAMGFTLRFPNSLMAVFSAYLINYTIPRAGEISRATILTNYEGVPFEKGFGTLSPNVLQMLL